MAPEPRRGLNVAFETISRRTLQYEQDIQDFESRLAINLSNSRAISTLLHESQSAVKELVQHYQQKADSALESTLPHIEQSLSEDINSLEFLDEHLPRIEEELVSIRRVYDRGQDKAVEHIAELEWLNTPLTARLRRTIFTASAPVSPRTKALLRMLFTLVFCMGVWVAWIALEGAVRAHRQRLVWGERLLS
ncbi:uncharacterized protein B0H18DRAFT_952035 [Fomitopsis serialis]|uniref:uncharacterized protein n=1 Tax=Fomitopsis serialis TaxID=139415 RepID=UPI00200789F2|nr:uncharacterized protein B0H18DRAFT_952035 [Neoantrodia serialis]KAH9933517.1 hypothetical protein B0H18DRAFT_952035 [Neoantrodia serialis]